MKRWERYAAQLELLAEAAFEVVRREGPAVLSRRGLAAELGASDAMARRTLGDHVSLPALAAKACETHRRRRRHHLPVLEQLLPDTEATDAAIVWLRLRIQHGTIPSKQGAHDLAERYQVATRGWCDPVTPGTGAAAPVEDVDPDRVALAGYFSDEDASTVALVSRLVGERADLVDAVHALVDGLVLGVCTGRLTAPAARSVLVDHLRSQGVEVHT
ncbi:hypothetical protein [Nocardioides rubriscoriae]|uniref:hypothetical protein n=1 Tax=Nocardioides rubriscoriae TaxID=642762 RepID=UPI0011E04C49|nr:hypothetical protein [Nocardioides rubriscoriae]